MIKKTTFIILGILVMGTSYAQKKSGIKKEKAKKTDEVGKVVAGVHAGLSLTGILYEALEMDTATLQYTTSVKPAFQATVDYFFTNKITVGFFTSVQPFRVDIAYWQLDTLKQNYIEDLQAKMQRIYIGGKILYHFKNTEKVDIYSGIRGGVLFWHKKLPSTHPNFITEFNEEFPMINRPTIGIIPIGFRVKFTPQIAVNIEINASSPHFLSFGGCYTLK